MRLVLVRHALEVKDHPDKDSPLGPPILEAGKLDAAELGDCLRARDVETERAITSTKQRTIDTAHAIGAKTFEFAELDEIPLTAHQKNQMAVDNTVPQHAIEKGEEIIEFLRGLDLDTELVVGHGGWLAGICYIAKAQLQVERFLPAHLEVRILET